MGWVKIKKLSNKSLRIFDDVSLAASLDPSEGAFQATPLRLLLRAVPKGGKLDLVLDIVQTDR